MVASGALMVTLPGCLTQNVQYDVPQNYPPSIESADTALFPLNSLIQFPSELEVEADGGTTTLERIPLRIDVRDPNVEQRLEYRLYIDFDSEAPMLTGNAPIPPNPPSLRRELEIFVPRTFLEPEGCHRIEVVVSSAFAGPIGRAPQTQGDVATATWWVVSDTDGINGVDATVCRW
ncbi:hypothetical protein [Sandaracinus amylolyticus]|uniref:hypothetical protein n=1 Tax=Sandaracinus amylolyticus TaxID=927083 RepID=UPI001F2E36B3|nr:hypothetical protein [Sandaracinus amylolyticus]